MAVSWAAVVTLLQCVRCRERLGQTCRLWSTCACSLLGTDWSIICAGQTAAKMHSASNPCLCQRVSRCRQAHTGRMAAMWCATCFTAEPSLCKQVLYCTPNKAGPACPAGLVGRSTPKARRSAAKLMGCTSASCAPAAPPAVPATGGTRTSTWAQQYSCRLTGEQAIFCKQGNAYICLLSHTSGFTSR